MSDANKPPIGVIIIVCIVIGAWWLWPSSEPDTPTYTKSQALIQSRTFVSDELKAPSTAEYGTDYNTGVQQLNDTVFVINSYVDSQNSYGAMLRNTYSCKLTYHIATGKVICDDLITNQ